MRGFVQRPKKLQSVQMVGGSELIRAVTWVVSENISLNCGRVGLRRFQRYTVLSARTPRGRYVGIMAGEGRIERGRGKWAGISCAQEPVASALRFS